MLNELLTTYKEGEMKELAPLQEAIEQLPLLDLICLEATVSEPTILSLIQHAFTRQRLV